MNVVRNGNYLRVERYGQVARDGNLEEMNNDGNPPRSLKQMGCLRNSEVSVTGEGGDQ